MLMVDIKGVTDLLVKYRIFVTWGRRELDRPGIVERINTSPFRGSKRPTGGGTGLLSTLRCDLSLIKRVVLTYTWYF